MRVLDLGCGIGIWVTEFAMRGLVGLHAADLTQQALVLCRKRLEIYGGSAEFSQQNAEKMTFFRYSSSYSENSQIMKILIQII